MNHHGSRTEKELTRSAFRRSGSYFRNQKIQTKLILGFGLQLALVAVVAAGGLFGLSHVQQSYQSAIGHGLEVERLAGTIKTELLEARRAEKDFLLNWQSSGSTAASDQHVAINRQHVARIHQAIAALETLQGGSESLSDTRIQDDLVALKPYVDVYAQDFQAAVELVGQLGSRASGVADRMQSKIEAIHAAALIVEPLAADIAASGKKEAEAEIADAQSGYRRSVITMISSFLAAITTGLGLGYVLGRQIERPLHALAGTAKAVGAGDLTAQAHVGSRDEIGTLAASFNAMTGQIRGLVASLEERVAERKKAQGLAIRKAAELQGVIDNMVDAVFVTDGEARVVLANQAGERLIGVQIQDIQNHPLHDVYARLRLKTADGKTLPYEQLPLVRALLGETVLQDEQLLVQKDTGRDLALRTSASPIYDATGCITGAVAIARDVTELRALDQMKDQFIRVAAHELKTPLAIMKGFAQLLLVESGSLEAPQKKMLDSINHGADRMNRIVMDLLDVLLFRSTGVGLKLASVPMDLSALVRDVASRMTLTATKHHIRVTAAESLPVCGDRGRIEQVIMNLIGNAIKYAPQGGPIDIDAKREGADAVVAVSDHGVGIATDRQEHVFDIFYRAHTDSPHDYGGMGIGLYLCREIVQLHGGKMWFASQPNVGSTFGFRLPVTEQCQ